MPYKPISNLKKMTPKAREEGRYKCAVCGKNAWKFKLEKPYCEEHWKEAEKEYQKKYRVKYYPENRERLCEIQRNYQKRSYIYHPRKLLTEEQIKKRNSKYAKEHHKKTYIPHPKKKSSIEDKKRMDKLRAERKRKKYFLNREEICRKKRKDYKKKNGGKV